MRIIVNNNDVSMIKSLVDAGIPFESIYEIRNTSLLPAAHCWSTQTVDRQAPKQIPKAVLRFVKLDQPNTEDQWFSPVFLVPNPMNPEVLYSANINVQNHYLIWGSPVPELEVVPYQLYKGSIYGRGLTLNHLDLKQNDPQTHNICTSATQIFSSTCRSEPTLFHQRTGISNARTFVGIQLTKLTLWSWADGRMSDHPNKRVYSNIWLGTQASKEKYVYLSDWLNKYLNYTVMTDTVLTNSIKQNLFYNPEFVETFPVLANKVTAIKEPKSIDDKVLKLISAKKATITLSEYTALKRAEEAEAKKIESMKALEEIIGGSDTQIKRSQHLVADFEQEIKFLLEKIAVVQKEYQEALVLVEPERKVLATIQEEKTKRSAAFEEASSKLIEQPDMGKQLLETLNNLGYVVTKLEYMLKGTVVDATKNTNIIFNKEAVLYKICVQAKQPSIITTYDRGTALKDQYACGPLKFTVINQNGAPSVTVGPVDLNSIFGIRKESNTYYYNAHPHIQQRSIYGPQRPSDWDAFAINLLTEYAPCQGEMTPALVNAFKNNDLLNVIFILKQWSESARVDDGYGASVRYFPLSSKIKTEISETVEQPTTPTTTAAETPGLQNILNTIQAAPAYTPEQNTATTTTTYETFQNIRAAEPDDEENEEEEDYEENYDADEDEEQEEENEVLHPPPVNTEYRPYRRNTNQG